VKHSTATRGEVPAKNAEFIPAGDTDRLWAVHRRIAEQSHKRLDRARARGGERFILLGTEHVPETALESLTSIHRTHRQRAHNPKVAGSNPAPAT
jgi:hypothetical protein